MSVLGARDPMTARKNPDHHRQGSEPTSTEKTNTKVEKELLRKARALADYEGQDLYDLLDAILRPVIEGRYKQMVKREAAD